MNTDFGVLVAVGYFFLAEYEIVGPIYFGICTTENDKYVFSAFSYKALGVGGFVRYNFIEGFPAYRHIVLVGTGRKLKHFYKLRLVDGFHRLLCSAVFYDDKTKNVSPVTDSQILFMELLLLSATVYLDVLGGNVACLVACKKYNKVGIFPVGTASAYKGKL